MLSLRSEWEFLISANLNSSRSGIWNAGGHSPEDHYDFPDIHREKGLLYYVYRKANEDRKTDSDLDQHLQYFENSKDQTGLGRYLKLRYNAFDPYNVLNLRKTTGPFYSADSYAFTDKEWDMYYWTDTIDQCPKLKDFILNDLPLDRIGIVTLFYNEHFVQQGFHRDYNYMPYEVGNTPDTYPHRQEFIWFRFDLDRPFYILDMDMPNGKIIDKYPVNGYSAFFNHHQWHGSFDSYPYSSVTVKVEGKFSEDFRKQLGIDHLEYYYK
jgi:hypothetical protein